RQRGLPVVNVTDRPYVHVRLAAIKFFLCHCLSSNVPRGLPDPGRFSNTGKLFYTSHGPSRRPFRSVQDRTRASGPDLKARVIHTSAWPSCPTLPACCLALPEFPSR